MNASLPTLSGRLLRVGAALSVGASLCWSCAPEPSDREAREEVLPAPSNGGAAFPGEASPEDPWEANLLLERRMTDEETLALLREHRALPYAVYGWTRWDHRVGAGPRAASESLVGALRKGATRRARGVICDPELLAGDPPADPGEARTLLADLLAAGRLLEALPAGEPIVYALRVTAPAGELRRMRDDPRVADLQAATRVDGLPVLPDVYAPPDLVASDSAPEVERLSDAAVLVAIRRVLEQAPCDEP